MNKVLVAGAGKIGTTVASMLADSGDYEVVITDKHFEGGDIQRLLQVHEHIKTVEIDMSSPAKLSDFLSKEPQQAIVSCLPFFLNIQIAQLAKQHNCHYFDLTEDTSVTAGIKEIAMDAKVAFVPQCGLAPGFVSIAANSLMHDLTKVDSVEMRVGALPQNSNNALQYAMTWSTEGLINEYGNMCHAIENGKEVMLHPLEGLELLQIDGQQYEAFNTSGGIGSLGEICLGKVNVMNYKTIRYPGHCEKMKVLMNDLKLNEDRETLKMILDRAIPTTYQDVVVVYIAVTGRRNGDLVEETFTKKIYPKDQAGLHWSAIQLTTAAGICSVVDQVFEDINKYHGLVLQEAFSLNDILNNRFGQVYK